MLPLPRPFCFQFVFLLRALFLAVPLAAAATTSAQLCTGSLGDPAVNITFGAGSNTDPALYTPTNSYTYVGTTCPSDGSFTLTASSPSCFNNAWHPLTADHTGDRQGNFMLINASFQPSDFFLGRVSGLCPNTTYEFAAWIINVLRSSTGIRPDVTFSIETSGGTVLKTYNTGSIAVTASPTWQQYGFYFTTPANAGEIVLRMTNNAPGGLGNDLALDDITFRPCGPRVDAEIVGADDAADVCAGDGRRFTFSATVAADYQDPVFQWQVSTDTAKTWTNLPGATAALYERPPTAAGTYHYRLQVVEASVSAFAACRIASNLVVVRVHPNPVVDAGPDRVLLKGSWISLGGKAEGEDLALAWTPEDGLTNPGIAAPRASPAADTRYTLRATSAAGCTSRDEVLVQVVNGIYVPTAFTPNGDGRNDRWQIPFLDPSFGARVSVYNRFGQLVYHASGSTVSWDGTFKGKPQAAGTYIYQITYPAGIPGQKGSLVLIR